MTVRRCRFVGEHFSVECSYFFFVLIRLLVIDCGCNPNLSVLGKRQYCVVRAFGPFYFDYIVFTFMLPLVISILPIGRSIVLDSSEMF